MPIEDKPKLRSMGFTLIELIVCITIIVLLMAVFVPRVTQYIDNANHGVAYNNAHTMYNAAQAAIIMTKSEYPEAFEYATKYKVDLNDSDPIQASIKEAYNKDSIKVGRFTNKSLYQYSNGVKSNNKSAKADMSIAKGIIEALPTGEYLVDCNPIDNRDSTKTISDNKDKYGKLAFAFCYDESGAIVYFEATCNGYFFKNIAGKTTVEKVSNDTYFCDWPKYSQRIDPSW